MAIARLFDRAAAGYHRIGHGLFVPAGAALVAVAALQPGDQVLDVGCGRGAALFPAAEAVGPSGFVTGIDLAPAMVEATQADIVRQGLLNARVQVGDAESPPFPARSFDAVLAGFVLFFLPDPAMALGSFARLLRRGGRLAVSTFADPTDQETTFTQTCRAALQPFLGSSPPLDNPPLQRLRTTESVIGLLDAAGFVDVQSTLSDVDCPTGCWYWLWSGGLRRLVDQVPTQAHDAARAAFSRAVGELDRTAGTLTGRVRFTTARLC